MKILNLTRNDIKKLEEYWINHEQNLKDLRFREWELLEEPIVTDNVGAGKNSVRNISKPTERKALLLAEDNLYNNLKNITTVIDELYLNLNDDEKTIIEMRYWCNSRDFSDWDDIAYELGYTRSKTLRIRNGILDEMAKRIGYV